MGVFNLNDDKEPTEDIATDTNYQPDSSSNVEQKEITDNELGVTNHGVTEVDNEKQEATVKLDGSLSSIYTAALNKVLAYEPALESTMVFNTAALADQFLQQQQEKTNDIYVYSCDAKELQQNGLAEAINRIKVAVDNNHYRQVIIAVECDQTVVTDITALEQLSQQVGAKLRLTRESALRTILADLRG